MLQLTSEKAVLIILIFLKTYLELLKYSEFQFQMKVLLKIEDVLQRNKY